MYVLRYTCLQRVEYRPVKHSSSSIISTQQQITAANTPPGNTVSVQACLLKSCAPSLQTRLFSAVPSTRDINYPLPPHMKPHPSLHWMQFNECLLVLCACTCTDVKPIALATIVAPCWYCLSLPRLLLFTTALPPVLLSPCDATKSVIDCFHYVSCE